MPPPLNRRALPSATTLPFGTKVYLLRACRSSMVVFLLPDFLNTMCVRAHEREWTWTVRCYTLAARYAPVDSNTAMVLHSFASLFLEIYNKNCRISNWTYIHFSISYFYVYLHFFIRYLFGYHNRCACNMNFLQIIDWHNCCWDERFLTRDTATDRVRCIEMTLSAPLQFAGSDSRRRQRSLYYNGNIW